MKRLLLVLLLIGLYTVSFAQSESPQMTGSVTGRKELSDATYTFNVGSAIPYAYVGSSKKLQIGFPYNALYMNRTFPGELFVSKGYFPDYIQLKWEVINNASSIDHFEVFRKKVGETDSVWIDNLDTNARKWEDYFCEANEVYEYTIHAIGIAGQKRDGYTRVLGIGFRTPLATVTGRVSFDGGTGVEGAVITASTADNVPSKSLALSNSSYIEIPQYNDLDFSNGFTFQTYLKFSTTGNAAIFCKGSNLVLSYINQSFVFVLGNETVALPFEVPTDEFVHVSAVYDGDTARIFVPSKTAAGVDTLFSVSAKITNSILANSDSILVGRVSSEYFEGNIDEVRIWKRALGKDEIVRDYNRYLQGNEDGFYAYLRANEGFGDHAYDISKSGSYFNANDGIFMGSNVTWSSVIPKIEQLGNRGITDEEGNYIIAGIPFLTDGSSYRFTPMLSPHEFQPSYKILFLSEDAVVHNNINFTDISSFKVNGSVAYRNTTLGVKKVEILVDGKTVLDANSKPVVTNNSGEFEISVPVGYHYISVRKAGHVFDNGSRWPYDPAHPDSLIRHNFIENLTFGEPFIDTTLVTVIGRVIGGTGSNDIAMGFGQSENNIGKATITLDHSSNNPELTFDNTGDALGADTILYTVATAINDDGDTTFTSFEHYSFRIENQTIVSASGETGEFVAKLIPEKFVIVDIAVNSDSGNNIKNFFGNKVIDLSQNPSLKYEKLYDENKQLIDSIPYNVKLNYIYQTTPEITVTNANDTVLFYGEKKIFYDNPETGNTDTIVVADHFKYPIFKMFADYSPKVSVFETYHNYDSNKDTRQPVKEAKVKITNNLALTDNVKTYNITSDMDGVVIDTFKTGTPNIAKSESDQTSFTKTMEVNVTVDGNSYTWKPGGKLYRAYISGQKPKGNSFYTEGPKVPEIILHDPPGSKSFAFIEQGSGYSVSSGYSTDSDNGFGMGVEVLLGATVQAGGGLAGPVIKAETKNSGKVGLSFSTTVNEKGEYVQSYEFNERIETSSEPEMVGSMADIYIGKSYNYYYGKTDNLKILPYDLGTDNCDVVLKEPELKDTEYTLGIVEGYIMNPDNSDTYFKYTQAHILYILLPEIEEKRNNLFLTSKRSDGTLRYKSYLEKEDARYGIAHSYEVVIDGGDTIVNGYFKMSESDSILSYSFQPEKETIEDLNNIENDTIYEIDSIRYYNDQIGIWIDAVRSNEAEKATAIEQNNLLRNISFDGGVGEISRSETQTISYKKEETRVKNFHFSALGSVGFILNGTGVVATGSLSYSSSLGVSVGEEFTQTMEYGYTLEDGNDKDYYSINIFHRVDNGIFNADSLQETKKEFSGDTWNIGGISLVSAVGAGVGAAYGGAILGLGASGGGAVIGAAALSAGVFATTYSPYKSFRSEVKDEGGNFSPGDIAVTSFNLSSPIFQTLGGATSCPYQGGEYTFFYRNAQGDSIELQKATLQIQKPAISAEPTEIHNVPITDKAFFNLKLTNNSESNEEQWYGVRVVEETNPHGAEILIDGLKANRTYLVPPNTTITKLLSLEPTDKSIMDYDSIEVIIYAPCQFDPTNFVADIYDKVYISAHFQPSCTNVEIMDPLDNWVTNVRDSSSMTIRIGNYDLDYGSFESFRFEYKPSSGSIWVPVKYFVNDPALENKDDNQDTLLINDEAFVTFDWDMSNLKDRTYDLRVVSRCSDGSENESPIISGILDNHRPQLFGTPQPADGILNIDDDIGITFNEPIEGGLLTQYNFEVKGTLNNYELKHEAYLQMNGSTDYGVIPEGISFNDKSFTIEFWMRPSDYRNSTILSQGNDPALSLEIGLKDNFKTFFKIGGVEQETALQFSPAVPEDAWQHMAYVFDYETGDMFIYQNDKIILEVRGTNANYNNLGKIYIGKSSVTDDDYFAGSFHELRIWSKNLPIGEVYDNQYTALSGNEIGLYGYWPLDEAHGDLAIDKAAYRHMEVFAPWETYPGGVAWDFVGNNSLKFSADYFAIIPEMDYTVEFWFKDSTPNDTVCFFSNQKGDGNDGENQKDKALSIYATPDGKIWVASKGYFFQATSNNYFDNLWHHFAFTVRRNGNAISYIDGKTQNEKFNTVFGGIAGSEMYLGKRKWDNINGAGEDWYYSGKMDEFRLWNLARTKIQINMDKNSKLNGNETGLMVYFPFENFFEDNMGVMNQQPTLDNFDSDENATAAVASVGDAYLPDAPNMKDIRPVESIAYDFVASEDEIIIKPKPYLYPQLENNTIEITVEKVEDKYGNRMASPVTWTAFVHRSQIRWEDEERNFVKEIYKHLDFVSSIKNTGGQQLSFHLTNLPPWLTASPVSGTIDPESTLDILFTVSPALNIGKYNEDIVIHTGNGFNEKLPVTVRVYKKPPDWKVNPNLFEYTMNMVGRVKIEGVLSTDIFDKVAVFVNDSIRGVANVRYVKEFDSYLVFLNIYGNNFGDELEFRLWDASVGQILDNVKPYDIQFVANDVIGTTFNPVIFEAVDLYRQYIPVASGWNWLSFNKLSNNQNNLNSFLSALESEENDQIKTHGGGFNNYDIKTGWEVGTIDSIDNTKMYQMKVRNADTIIYSGGDIIPEDNPIDIAIGWNHIGYLPDLAMDLNDALRYYVADTSEVIKGQYSFVMYDPNAGWLGTLDVMKPGRGYMMHSNRVGVLKYPNTTVFKSGAMPNYSSPPSGWEQNLSQYANNLSIVAKIDFTATPEVTVNNQMVLGAFINSENHGYVSPLSSSGTGSNLFFLSVSNNEKGQSIGFKLFDGITGKTYEIKEKRPFVANAVYGSTQSPLILTLKSTTTGASELAGEGFFRCYPNPFTGRVNIEFRGFNEEVQIDVVNATGSLISHIYNGLSASGINTITWDGTNQNGVPVSAGIYYIRYVSGNSVEIVKISKAR